MLAVLDGGGTIKVAVHGAATFSLPAKLVLRARETGCGALLREAAGTGAPRTTLSSCHLLSSLAGMATR